jgi:hypothetical protein
LKNPDRLLTETAWIVVLSFTAGDVLVIFCIWLKTSSGPLCYQSCLMIYLSRVHSYRQRPVTARGRREDLNEIRRWPVTSLSNWSERLGSLTVQLGRLSVIFLSLFKQTKVLK